MTVLTALTDFLVSPAYAQTAGAGGMAQGLVALLPYVLIFGVFYFLLIRPQQVKAKQLKARLAALKRGDRVLTSGGIIGVVQKNPENGAEVEVEIAPEVRVKILRETITEILTPPAQAEKKPAKK